MIPRSERLTTAVLLLVSLFSAGCERRPDRLVTADGSVLSGRLESVEGGTVVISGSRAVLDREEGRLFPRDGSAGCRGPVSFENGSFTVGSGPGATVMEAEDVGSIVWSPPSSESRTDIEVHASAGWVDTGLDLTETDRLVVTASGTVTMETGTCGPEGIEYFSTAMALVPGATNGQLVMMVDDGSPVAVGSGWTGDSPGRGRLMLAVNRPNRESVAGVGGSYSVTVVRTPGVLGNSVLYPSPD
ncbi:MAG: hypothetical protein AVO35_07310 [Candidatus Aegiribacteria sp. MLS_C]|nr:MAG: hypothetical protein AVO35_07310 [Candidatus Aegiribacteria sp. MLS_C]